ncbi:Autophagy-related protein [Mycena indigotica]|uniref:Ubiquitin-like modifier-activating enzyme ATG7 n=1 Tax=Mycena indigotica TaxID=2126181 RepID=A0A8H6TEW0_9AGAR|nr:Autophagy-related protein [Mycena indigotica]KAF7316230.1 Autophagy-related protein [Mycena indigotica]
MPIVQFAPFSSLVQPTFWHELTSLKIDVLRLSDEAVPITGSYSVGRSITDRETGHEIVLGCNMSVGSESFDKNAVAPAGSFPAKGHLKNYNTIEEFKAADKTALFNQEADKMWEAIVSKRDSTSLNNFLVITFADLKKYKYYYWFAFPAFAAKPAWEIDELGWRLAASELSPESLSSIHSKLHATPLPFFLLRSGLEIAPIDSYSTFFANVPPEEQTIGFVDPSASPTNPGWPLRNLLAYLRAVYPETTSRLRVLCWRDSEVPHAPAGWKSRIGVVHITPSPESGGRPSAVGWEKNPQGKLAPRMADLAPMMDPTRLADQAVDLNLKLMRWRILPSLDLEKISSTKCLLLGAGTLGCYVARTLMGWGVRDITLVDSGKVSFSNPVRQPLFEFEDCLEGGKPKAECAAARMKKIFPGINAAGHSLSIPMPGHPVPPASVDQTRADVKKLEELIDTHDAVFLLMDSRESRWLPTVICAAKGKIVLNAALGFDTFLVMRHGVRESSLQPGATQLGCYYCNDIVAPADSLTDRTLDEMCTVTRPGIASLASSTAVELLASVLQHPDGVHAAAPPANSDPAALINAGVLGLVPHQLRGFLAQFRNLHIVGAAYSRCTGCSETVLKAYEKEGFDMILQALNDDKYLQHLTGLDTLYAEGEKALEEVDWDVDDEEGEDF